MRDMWQIAVGSHRLGFALLQRMTLQLFIAIVMLVVISLVGSVVERQMATTIGRVVVSTLFSVGGSWAAAPYLVALYRFALLGEVAANPEKLRGTDAANRLFGWTSVAAFIWAIPLIALALLTPPGMSIDDAVSAKNMAAVWVVFFLLVALWVFTMRMVTLLPAAALGEDSSFATGFTQTRGRFWFIVGTLFLSVIPFSLGSTLLRLATGDALDLVLALALVVFGLTIGIALSANLYRWLMDHPK